MPVDWKNPKAFTRLLAAMVAAQDMKVCPGLWVHAMPLYSHVHVTRIMLSIRGSIVFDFYCNPYYFTLLSVDIYLPASLPCTQRSHVKSLAFARVLPLTFNSQLDYKKIASMYGQGIYRPPATFTPSTSPFSSPPNPPRYTNNNSPTQEPPMTLSKAASASSKRTPPL